MTPKVEDPVGFLLMGGFGIAIALFAGSIAIVPCLITLKNFKLGRIYAYGWIDRANQPIQYWIFFALYCIFFTGFSVFAFFMSARMAYDLVMAFVQH